MLPQSFILKKFARECRGIALGMTAALKPNLTAQAMNNGSGFAEVGGNFISVFDGHRQRIAGSVTKN